MGYFYDVFASLAETAGVEGPPRPGGRSGTLEHYAADLLDAALPAARREAERDADRDLYRADDRLGAIAELERVAIAMLDYAADERSRRAFHRSPRASKTSSKTAVPQAPRVTVGRITMRGGTR